MSNEQGPIKAISELALWVQDLERALGFYRDYLGFEVQEIDPGRNAFLRSGNFLLVLFVRDNPGTKLADEYLARTGGARGEVYHVAFMVERRQLDTLAAELQDRAVTVRGPVDFETGRRSYFLEDPDEHYIELTDR